MSFDENELIEELSFRMDDEEDEPTEPVGDEEGVDFGEDEDESLEDEY